MKRFILAILAASLALISTAAAQNPGNFPAGYVYGNNTAATKQPSAASLTSMFDRAFCGTNSSALARVAGVWVCTQTLPNAIQDNITRLGAVSTITSLSGLPAPACASCAATKDYVDSTAAGRVFHPAALVATATGVVLPNSPTYNNGASGVGATLTAGSNAALVVDGTTVSVVGTAVLVKDQASTLQNGEYTLTTAGVAGGGGNPWIITRDTSMDAPAEMVAGETVFVQSGSTNANTSWTLSAAVTAVGTSPVTFVNTGGAGNNTWGISATDIFNNNAGNVGIGTTTPSSALDVSGTTSSDARGITSSQFSSDTTSAQFLARKARGSVAVPTTVVTNDYLAALVSAGYDGVAYQQTAAILFQATGTVASNSIPTDIVFRTGATGTGTERLRITSAGVVTIAGLAGLGSGCSAVNNSGSFTGVSSCLPSGGSLNQGVYNSGSGTGTWATNAEFNISAVSGVDCTGATNTNTAAALTTAFAASYNVFVPKGCTLKLGANFIVANGSTLRIEKGGLINVDSTFTLTINGTCNFGIYQVFNGAGSVVGCKVNHPEWWPNCPNTGKTGAVDHAACITSAVTSMMASSGSDGGDPTVLFSQGFGATPGYYIKSCLNFKVSSAVNAHYLGAGQSTQGANITAASVANGFSGTCATQVTNTTSATSVNFQISGIHMINDDPAHDIRCMVVGEGSAAKRIEGSRHSSLIQNNTCTDFPTGIRQVNARLIVYDRISVKLPTSGSGTAMIWDIDTNGDNSGDTIIQNSQVECTYGQSQTGVRIRAEQDSTSGLQGLTFTSFTSYYCDKQIWISAASGSNTSDHIFTDNRWDGVFGVGMYVTTDNVAGGTLCTDRSCVINISVNNVYMQGAAGIGFNLVSGRAETIRDVSISGGYLNGSADRFVYAERITGFNIGSGIKLGTISGVTQAMYFTASASLLFNGVNAWNHGAGAQVTYGATIAGASDGWCLGSNNVYAWASSTFLQNSSSPGASHTTCNAP